VKETKELTETEQFNIILDSLKMSDVHKTDVVLTSQEATLLIKKMDMLVKQAGILATIEHKNLKVVKFTDENGNEIKIKG